VRIERNRVSQFDAAKLVFVFRRKREWSTVSGVDVIPATILTSEGGQLFEWIDNTRRSRAGNADDATRTQPGFTIARDRFSQCIDSRCENDRQSESFARLRDRDQECLRSCRSSSDTVRKRRSPDLPGGAHATILDAAATLSRAHFRAIRFASEPPLANVPKLFGP
jgi:hypothetical protein